MNSTNSKLNDIVAVARDGQNFYSQAAGKVDDPELKTLFTRLAASKGDVVASLSKEIRVAGDKPTASGTFVGEMSKIFGDLRAIGDGKDYAYVAQLEQTEDRLVKAVDEAIADKDVATKAKDVLIRLAPEVHTCHDLMSKRKKAMKLAS